MDYHTTPTEMAKIINIAEPKLTVLTHILALGGTTDLSILNSVKSKLNKDYKVKKIDPKNEPKEKLLDRIKSFF